MDLVGMEVIPIAEIFSGNFLCIDFREDLKNPNICIWLHEKSDEFDPCTIIVADNFTNSLEMLK